MVNLVYKFIKISIFLFKLVVNEVSLVVTQQSYVKYGKVAC